MDENELGPVAIKDMDKCATIYRSNAVSFIYVCYHCGADFNNIDSTLKHIESHFQVVQVTVDPIDTKNVKSEQTDIENASDDNLFESDSIGDATEIEQTIDIKTEIMETEAVSDSLEDSNHFDCKVCGSTFTTKFALRSHTLKNHLQQQELECAKCGKKFKRDASFKNHVRLHIDRGDVDWKCESDGIREPSSIGLECSEQQERVGSSKKKTEKVQPEKGKTKKRHTEDELTEKEQVKKAKVVKVKPEKRTVGKQKPEKAKKDVSDKPSTERNNYIAKIKIEEKTYICHKCSEIYSTSTELNDHLRSHCDTEMLLINKCKECKTFFETAFDLRLHVLEVHLLMKEFQCSSCFIEFRPEDKLLLERHLELHLANHSAKFVNIRHGVCNKGMNATAFEEITTTSEMCCELCEEKFYLKSNLEEHTGFMHYDNDNKLRCAQCDAVFAKTKSYFAHQFEHRRVGANITETDMKVLVNNLNSYISKQFVCNVAENDENTYKCSICYMENDNLAKMKVHVRERHVYKILPQPIKPILKEKISCSVCGMIITRSSFRTHYLSHVDAKKFPCSFCGKIFSKNYSKKTHERMHTGEKPFQCDQCGKRFFSNSLLGAHKQQHDNKTFPCKICGRVFNLSSGYRRHMQTHRKDQSFECTICSKSFNTRVYLTRHLHKHNEKSWQCSFCENKFRSAKGKRQHEKLQHHYEPPI